MTILVEGVTHDNVYEERFGIVEEETLFFFFTVVLVPLIWGINPWYIKRWIQRKMHQGSHFSPNNKPTNLCKILNTLWESVMENCLNHFGLFFCTLV